MYAIFFIFGTYLARNKIGNTILSTALMGSGYVLVLFGLFNWLGNGKFAGSLVGWFVELDKGIYRDAVMTDSNGLRLTSVFQYANSYAAYLIALLFASLFLVAKSRKWYIIGINAFMLVPIIISFFLTLSRGAIVVIPFILLIILFFQKLNRQILILVHMVLAFIASFVILQKITDAGIELNKQFSSSLSRNSWLIVIGVSLAVALLSILIQKFAAPYLERKLERFNGHKLTNIVVPIAAIVIGIVGALLIFADTGASKLLPENVRTRLANINFAQHSVLERGTFYKDAIKVFKDYPLLGAGGGAWSALYEKYQSNPYISRQAHNFFLQYLVEVGIIGLLIFLLFLGAVFYLFIRKYINNQSETKDSHFLFFIIAVSLLIHSLIDFDLSYVYLGILLFLGYGFKRGGRTTQMESGPASHQQRLSCSAFRIITYAIFHISQTAKREWFL
jgi:O-antigen ligase